MKFTTEEVREYIEFKYTNLNTESVKYEGKTTRLLVTCTKHNNKFARTFAEFKRGLGCIYCLRESGIEIEELRKTTASSFSNPKRKTISDIVNASIKIHGDKYSYNNLVYTGALNKFSATCPTHGDWQTTVCSLLSRKRGCPICSISKPMTQQTFIQKSKQIHGNRYDYSLVNYVNSKTNVLIKCKKHGVFDQRPDGHLSGLNCIKCSCSQSTSYKENEIINFLKLSFPSLMIEQSNRTVLGGKELDIYLPDFKLSIEFNGLYYHSTYGTGLRSFKPKDYHRDKYLKCREQGVALIHIFEDEWVNPVKQEIWKSIIANKLGKTENKVYARKCEIRDLTWKETKAFLDENHLMGADSAPIRLGLFSNQELVAVLTFAKPSLAGGDKSYDFNLSRFAVKRNTNVVGGFSKLLKHFQRLNPSSTLTTAADLRYSTGDVYLKNGFELLHETKPNYWYWKSKPIRYHRFNFRKQVLAKKLENYDENLTERENMLNNKWNIIFDAGNAIFKLSSF